MLLDVVCSDFDAQAQCQSGSFASDGARSDPDRAGRYSLGTRLPWEKHPGNAVVGRFARFSVLDMYLRFASAI